MLFFTFLTWKMQNSSAKTATAAATMLISLAVAIIYKQKKLLLPFLAAAFSLSQIERNSVHF